MVEEGGFFDGRFGYGPLVEVSCGAYESRLGRELVVRKGRHFPSVKARTYGDPDV